MELGGEEDSYLVSADRIQKSERNWCYCCESRSPFCCEPLCSVKLYLLKGLQPAQLAAPAGDQMFKYREPLEGFSHSNHSNTKSPIQ